MAIDDGFHKRPAKHETTPRRVRGGIRCKSKVWPAEGLSWLGRSFFNIFEQALALEGGGQERLNESFALCQRGQTRRIEVLPGRIVASVQGHKYKANDVTITFPVFSHETWERLIETMSEQSLFSARILAGEMPSGLDTLLSSEGLELLPGSPAEVRVQHTYAEESGFSWYALVAAILTTEMIEADPFLVFALRGMVGEELIERLRQRRAATSAGGRASGLFVHPAFDTESAQGSLAESVDRFWDVGDELDHLDTTPRRPEVSHALLRRLGPTPFTESRFPLLGLLATCYDVISERSQTVRDPERGSVPEGGEPAGEAVPVSEAEPEKPQKTAADVMKARIEARRASKPKAKAKKV